MVNLKKTILEVSENLKIYYNWHKPRTQFLALKRKLLLKTFMVFIGLYLDAKFSQLFFDLFYYTAIKLNCILNKNQFNNITDTICIIKFNNPILILYKYLPVAQ